MLPTPLRSTSPTWPGMYFHAAGSAARPVPSSASSATTTSSWACRPQCSMRGLWRTPLTTRTTGSRPCARCEEGAQSSYSIEATGSPAMQRSLRCDSFVLIWSPLSVPDGGSSAAGNAFAKHDPAASPPPSAGLAPGDTRKPQSVADVSHYRSQHSPGVAPLLSSLWACRIPATATTRRL